MNLWIRFVSLLIFFLEENGYLHKNPFESECSLYGREQDVQRDCFPHSHYSSPVFWDRHRTAELSICCQISVCTRRTAVCIRMAGGRQLPSLLIQIMLVRGFQIQNPSVSDTKPTSSWTNLEMFKRFVEAETM